MQRPGFYRTTQVTVITFVALILVWSAVSHTAAQAGTALLFALLVAASGLLTLEDDSVAGFEAAVALAVILIFHDAGIALMAVAAGGAIETLYRGFLRRTWGPEGFYQAAQTALSSYVVALLYSSAVARSALPAAKLSGYILLLVGYLVAHLLWFSVRRYFEDESTPLDMRGVLLSQGRTLLFISPIVGIEVMLYAAYGLPGFVAGFVPLLVVEYALRGEARTGVQNVDLLRRNKELAILTENSTQILSAETDQESLRRLTGLLSSLAKMKACAVVTWEANPDVAGTVYRFAECLPTDQEILRWVDSAGFAQSAPSRAFIFHDEQRRFPLSSGRAIQVLIGIQTPEVIYGILIFETEDSSILKAGSLNLLTLLVNQAGLSLQDQLLRREMREKNVLLESQAARLSTILEVARTLIEFSSDVDGALRLIAEEIRKAIGFSVVVFALFDPKKNVYIRRAHTGLDDVWEDARERPIGAAEIDPFFNPEFRLSNSYFVSHTALRQSEHDFFVRPEEPKGRHDEWHENDMLIVPLLSGDEKLGFVSVRDPHDGRRPSFEMVQTLEIFALLAVTALRSARQYQQIEKLTYIDGLTGAFNHRHFQEALPKEIHRHQRSNSEFALAMLDIDNFKKINDTFGHPVGDGILKGLVEELMENARDSDVVARYGGEEFALIFPETPSGSAREAANRMREIAARREFVFPQLGRTLRITVSIGVAVYPQDGDNGADLIARVDAALYTAKKLGKNCVAMAADLPASSSNAAM